MDIGEIVIYRRREYRISGFDPQGVVPRKVYLEDVHTGKRLTVALPDLSRQRLGGGGQLRLVERDIDDQE